MRGERLVLTGSKSPVEAKPEHHGPGSWPHKFTTHQCVIALPTCFERKAIDTIFRLQACDRPLVQVASCPTSRSRGLCRSAAAAFQSVSGAQRRWRQANKNVAHKPHFNFRCFSRLTVEVPISWCPGSASVRPGRCAVCCERIDDAGSCLGRSCPSLAGCRPGRT